jgi:hypothetical protein
MQSYYTFIALELARERIAEANAQRLASLAHPGEPRTAGIRRVVARIASAVGQAAHVRAAESAADAEVGRVPLGDTMISLLGGRHRS